MPILLEATNKKAKGDDIETILFPRRQTIYGPNFHGTTPLEDSGRFYSTGLIGCSRPAANCSGSSPSDAPGAVPSQKVGQYPLPGLPLYEKHSSWLAFSVPGLPLGGGGLRTNA